MTAISTSLHQIGIAQPTWKTVIVAASQEAAIPLHIVWDTWSRLEDWPSWSKPLHVAARWVGQPGWKVGTTFEQRLNLGFPLGTITSSETVGAVVPNHSVMWWKEENGIISCHRWEFETLSENRTHITNVEVFHGTVMGLMKLLVAKRWQRLFEQSVAGLIQHAEQYSTIPDIAV